MTLLLIGCYLGFLMAVIIIRIISLKQNNRWILKWITKQFFAHSSERSLYISYLHLIISQVRATERERGKENISKCIDLEA